MFRVYTDDEGNTYTILQLLKKVLKDMDTFYEIVDVEEGEHFSESGTPSVELRKENNQAVFVFNYMKGSKGDTGAQGPQGPAGTSLYKHQITDGDTIIEIISKSSIVCTNAVILYGLYNICTMCRVRVGNDKYVPILEMTYNMASSLNTFSYVFNGSLVDSEIGNSLSDTVTPY